MRCVCDGWVCTYSLHTDLEVDNHCVCLCTDKQEQQCRQLMAGLDKVISDLDKQEKAIYTRVRPPLEQTRPLQDSADRLQDMRVSDMDFFLTIIIILFFS